MENNFNVVTFSNGVSVINTTPHPLTFLDGEEVINVPTSVLINAKAIEEPVKGIFVKTKFVGTDEGRTIIDEIRKEFPDVIIVGSIIAAQAFPEEVVGMTPAPGFERVAPDQKRMNIGKFTIFEK